MGEPIHKPIRDGDWLLIEHDPAAQRMVWMTEQDGMTVVRTDYYGAAALRDENAEAEKATQGRRFGDWVRVASVPLNELRASGLDRAIREGHDGFVSRWLNDSDNRGYRTSRGRV
jgi:hypothetical protein